MRRVALLFAIMVEISLIASGAPQKRLAVLDFDYGLVRDQVAAVFGTDLDDLTRLCKTIPSRLVQRLSAT